MMLDDETNLSEEGTNYFFGDITREEFLTLPNPSYNDVVRVFDEVVSQNPNLLESEEEAAVAIFRKLQEEDGKRQVKNIIPDILELLPDDWDTPELSDDEWDVISVNPFDAMFSYSAIGDSVSAAIREFECEKDDRLGTKLDALRHAYWSALVSRRTNREFAEGIGTAHETGYPDNNALDMSMDLHNNAFGRRIEAEYPDASEEELLDILRKEQYRRIESPSDISDSSFRYMVYYKNEAPLDGNFVGSLTNPDSGILWELLFSFTQCGNDVKGQYFISNESLDLLQIRRFDGTYDDALGTVRLDVNAPYVFEGFGFFCRNMVMELQTSLGEIDTISGFWSSSNCRLGGEVNAYR